MMRWHVSAIQDSAPFIGLDKHHCCGRIAVTLNGLTVKFVLNSLEAPIG
jgi:hypothetical protein